MTVRQRLENEERQRLAPYARLSSLSLGREKPLAPCDLRTDFQRDRDRIIHCKAFRRLKHKTQCFVSPEGDHFRTRLTHTLEVSQIARTIARALMLNEDLAEAIALGHDLGHTPFGHMGERTLNSLTGRFKHNEQSLRVVDKLEKGGEGLNLTWETRDGILNHTLEGSPATLEGQVVSLADRIAYLNHDFDDAVRAGVISPGDLPKEVLDAFGGAHGLRIDGMITDAVSNSGEAGVKMSESAASAMDAMRAFMFERVYDRAEAAAEEVRADFVIRRLFEYYSGGRERVADDLFQVWDSHGDKTAAQDMIAGMTDRVAVRTFNELFVPGVRY